MPPVTLDSQFKPFLGITESTWLCGYSVLVWLYLFPNRLTGYQVVLLDRKYQIMTSVYWHALIGLTLPLHSHHYHAWCELDLWVLFIMHWIIPIFSSLLSWHFAPLKFFVWKYNQQNQNSWQDNMRPKPILKHKSFVKILFIIFRLDVLHFHLLMGITG